MVAHRRILTACLCFTRFIIQIFLTSANFRSIRCPSKKDQSRFVPKDVTSRENAFNRTMTSNRKRLSTIRRFFRFQIRNYTSCSSFLRASTRYIGRFLTSLPMCLSIRRKGTRHPFRNLFISSKLCSVLMCLFGSGKSNSGRIKFRFLRDFRRGL